MCSFPKEGLISVPTIIVHGGIGEVSPDKMPGVMKMLKVAAAEGYHTLMKGDSAVDAIEQAILCLETSDYFNVGYGLSAKWRPNLPDFEVEASIMDGATMDSGAAASLKLVFEPITLARRIMEETPGDLRVGDEAARFYFEEAIRNHTYKRYDRIFGCEYYSETSETEIPIEEYPEEWKKYGTVGAVACDINGNLAAGTSSGSPMGYMPGRIGNSAIIGLGTYADNTVGAISTTGADDSIMKTALANSISLTMQKRVHPVNACRINVQKFTKRFGTEAGAIAISKNGEVGFGMSSPNMPVVYIKNDIVHFGSTTNKIRTELGYTVYLKRKMHCCCTGYRCVTR